MIELLEIKKNLEALRDGGAEKAYAEHPDIAGEIAARAQRTIDAIDARIALTAAPAIVIEETPHD